MVPPPPPRGFLQGSWLQAEQLFFMGTSVHCISLKKCVYARKTPINSYWSVNGFLNVTYLVISETRAGDGALDSYIRCLNNSHYSAGVFLSNNESTHKNDRRLLKQMISILEILSLIQVFNLGITISCPGTERLSPHLSEIQCSCEKLVELPGHPPSQTHKEHVKCCAHTLFVYCSSSAKKSKGRRLQIESMYKTLKITMAVCGLRAGLWDRMSPHHTVLWQVGWFGVVTMITYCPHNDFVRTVRVDGYDFGPVIIVYKILENIHTECLFLSL